MNSPIKVVPIRLDFFSYSQKYQETMYIENIMQHQIENNRMIPNIDDNGMVKGSYLMINYKNNQLAYDIINVDLSDDKNIIKNNLCRI
jgi:hypothetical protein